MASTVPVLPIGQVSYGTDRAVSGAQDIILHLRYFVDGATKDPSATNRGDTDRHGEAIPGPIRIVPVEGATGENVIYVRDPEQNEKGAIPHVKLYKYAIGPLEVSLALDEISYGVTLLSFAQLPIVGTVALASSGGDINEGVALDLKYPGVVSGANGASKGRLVLTKKQNGPNAWANLAWSVRILGKDYTGTYNLFKLNQ